MKASDYQKHKNLLPLTPSDILGPFYRPGAPERSSFCNYSTLTLTMRALDQEGSVLSYVTFDVWHADLVGDYDDSPEFHFRGKLRASFSGTITLTTIVPGDYKISDPGEPDDFRCAHIHVIVTAPGYKSLTTQLYFPSDPYNATDHWFDKRRVIVPPNASFDFVLEKENP